MTKEDVFDIITDFVEYFEKEYTEGVGQFYDFKDLDDPHYGEDYLEQREKFFDILKKALDISTDS